MKKQVLRGLGCSLALLSIIAVAAAPANATFTPPGGRFSRRARNVQVVFSNGLIIRCPTADYTGTINAAGTAMSIIADYSRGGGLTCVTNTGISVADFRLAWTFRSIASVGGTSASGDAVIDVGSNSISFPALGCSITISGPQTIRSAWTFSQASQTMTMNARGIVATGSGGLCGGALTATITGSYAFASGNRVTIS